MYWNKVRINDVLSVHVDTGGRSYVSHGLFLKREFGGGTRLFLRTQDD